MRAAFYYQKTEKVGFRIVQSQSAAGLGVATLILVFPNFFLAVGSFKSASTHLSLYTKHKTGLQADHNEGNNWFIGNATFVISVHGWSKLANPVKSHPAQEGRKDACVEACTDTPVSGVGE